MLCLRICGSDNVKRSLALTLSVGKVWITSGYSVYFTQSRIIGAVRGAHSQLWGTIIPVCSPYAPRKYDKRFGTPAIV